MLLPPARPDLPILIAAKRPRMLELTARHADAWNMAWFGDGTHAEVETPALTGDAESVAAGFGRHADAGVDHIIVALEPTTPTALARLTEALARYRADREG